jgi:hypothetical protein
VEVSGRRADVLDWCCLMDERTQHRRLDREAAQEIIRRAADLDADPVAASEGIDRQALEAAALEVGISSTAVRLAMAEHDAGALVHSGDRNPLGPARTHGVRTVGLPAAVARSRVERWLRSQLLEVHARRGEEVEWRRRGDLTAKLRRRLDPARRVRLGDVDAIVVSVVAAGDERSVVRIDADLSVTRSGLLTGVVAVPSLAGPLLGGAAALVLSEPLLLVGGVPAGLALGGAGLVAGRRALATERAEAARVVDLFLEEMARER